MAVATACSSRKLASTAANLIMTERRNVMLRAGLILVGMHGRFHSLLLVTARGAAVLTRIGGMSSEKALAVLVIEAEETARSRGRRFWPDCWLGSKCDAIM